jgi:serine/threonine-protein kinase
MDDIFAVQDEIANAIVQALQIKFMGGTLSRRAGGTQNLEAYQLYLRAENEDTNTKSSIDAAEDYLKRAIKLDSDYGSAWQALGNIVGIKTEGGLVPAKEGWEEARRLTKHSLQLSPELAEAHVYLSYIHMYFDWDWMAAKSELQRAFAIDPKNLSALGVAGMLSRTLGRWNDAERNLRAVLTRDPLATTAIFHLGLAYYLSGRLEEAEGMYRHLLELDPTWTWARLYLGKALLAQDKPEEALATIQLEADDGARVAGLPVFLQAAGRQAEADRALQSLIERWGDSGAYGVALTYAYRGDHDRALEWLGRAYEQKDAGLAEIVGEPIFNGMADDPRFKAFLRKMNLPEQW